MDDYYLGLVCHQLEEGHVWQKKKQRSGHDTHTHTMEVKDVLLKIFGFLCYIRPSYGLFTGPVILFMATFTSPLIIRNFKLVMGCCLLFFWFNKPWDTISASDILQNNDAYATCFCCRFLRNLLVNSDIWIHRHTDTHVYIQEYIVIL